tara:strand:- start:182 stop:607 length:426 start_codon:yes stop_codon:yes gene_type:complete
MAIKLSYTQLLDEIQPSLEILGDLTYGEETPISHLLNIAENLKLIEDKAKIFWTTREKLLEPYIEKDEDGKNKTEMKLNPMGEKVAEFLLTDENKVLWMKKFEELRQTKVSINLNKLDTKHFEGAKDVKANDLKACWELLK